MTFLLQIMGFKADFFCINRISDINLWYKELTIHMKTPHIDTIVLFDTPETWENLLPLSYSRPVCDFRVGIMTIREKWEDMWRGISTSALTVDYLQEKFPMAELNGGEALFIAGNVVPDEILAEAVAALEPGESLVDSQGLVALRGTLRQYREVELAAGHPVVPGIGRLQYVFDIFRLNGNAIRNDYRRMVSGRESCAPDRTVTVIGPMTMPDGLPSVFIEEGAVVEGAILNVKDGPIYIGKDAAVMEGSCVRGPLALCGKAKIKMGAKIYGSTTIGPYCKVGGEVDNTVIFGFSNKAHDGYLGNAVIGEWCNIGAGANASNLKNDYSKIRIWNYVKQGFMRTNLQFCGLIMGDHSKAGINCMFNTATVVGVGVNLHGAGFPRNFIPSFSAGSPEGGFTDVSIDKFMETAGRVMARRGIELSDVDRRICEYIYASAMRFKTPGRK